MYNSAEPASENQRVNIFGYYIKTITFFIACLFFILATVHAVADNQSRIQQVISQYKSAPSDLKGASTQNMINELLLNPSSRKALDSSTKQIIKEQFNTNLGSETIILASLAGIESAQEKIKALAAKPIPKEDWFGTDWAARLMMARLGDQTSLNDIMTIANRQDLHKKSIIVAIDFKYVPQLTALDFLIKQLFSNERLESEIENGRGSIVAKYAISSLAVLLKNFPLEYRDHFGYTDDEVILAREWISKQTEWKFR